MPRALVPSALLVAGCPSTPSTSPQGTGGARSDVLRPRFAGQRYTAEPNALRGTITYLLGANEELPSGAVRALLVPQGALEFAGSAVGRAFQGVGERDEVRRVVVLAHSTQPGVRLASASRAASPLGEVTLEKGSAGAISAESGLPFDDSAFGTSPGLEAVLPFIQVALPRTTVLPLAVGDIGVDEAEQLARALAPVLDRHTLVIAVANTTRAGPRFKDLRFGAETVGAALDQRVAQADRILLEGITAGGAAMAERALTATNANIGAKGVLRALGALVGPRSAGVVMVNETSWAHEQSDPANVVGYAAVVFPGTWPEMPPLFETDRLAAVSAVRAGLALAIDPTQATPASWGSNRMAEPRGAFVSVYVDGQLRGSAGRLVANQPLGRTLVEAAGAALATRPGEAKASAAEIARAGIRIDLVADIGPLDAIDGWDPDRQVLLLDVDGHEAMLLPSQVRAGQLGEEAALDSLAELGRLPREQWGPESLAIANLRTLTDGPVPDASAGAPAPNEGQPAVPTPPTP